MTIDITTTGRRSGQARRIEIWFLNVDAAIYITGSTGTETWFANLLRNPQLTFHLKETTAADLPAKAIVVKDAAERQRVFAAATAKWYKDQEPLEDLVNEAPMGPNRVRLVGH